MSRLHWLSHHVLDRPVLHARDAAYLYVKQRFIWHQFDHQDRNIRVKGVTVSVVGTGTDIILYSRNELQQY